ncbi:uncharacterized protein FA14DRAFT_186731 [Meira miltonrushii]|uniref:Uncharacterized protein n=1 Tax=Meira miltonrushii TaxID=1280837 RepID=A0A316VG98_9BASI|nr:uncharacterized protein FA14DRAFT_186731 [Meira miltonrushii]PWN36520.1 hypothetical protein FA14DRAFT_186731 [Meira miltonrushii]
MISRISISFIALVLSLFLAQSGDSTPVPNHLDARAYGPGDTTGRASKSLDGDSSKPVYQYADSGGRPGARALNDDSLEPRFETISNTTARGGQNPAPTASDGNSPEPRADAFADTGFNRGSPPAPTASDGSSPEPRADAFADTGLNRGSPPAPTASDGNSPEPRAYVVGEPPKKREPTYIRGNSQIVGP